MPRGVCADRRAGQFLLSGHGLEGTPSGWGTKQDSWPRGRKATCVDMGLLETGISRNADILSRPTSTSLEDRGGTVIYVDTHTKAVSPPFPSRCFPPPHFSFHSVWKEPGFWEILSAVAISSSPRAKELLDDSQRSSDPTGSLSGVWKRIPQVWRERSHPAFQKGVLVFAIQLLGRKAKAVQSP